MCGRLYNPTEARYAALPQRVVKAVLHQTANTLTWDKYSFYKENTFDYLDTL